MTETKTKSKGGGGATGVLIARIEELVESNTQLRIQISDLNAMNEILEARAAQTEVDLSMSAEIGHLRGELYKTQACLRSAERQLADEVYNSTKAAVRPRIEFLDHVNVVRPMWSMMLQVRIAYAASFTDVVSTVAEMIGGNRASFYNEKIQWIKTVRNSVRLDKHGGMLQEFGLREAKAIVDIASTTPEYSIMTTNEAIDRLRVIIATFGGQIGSGLVEGLIRHEADERLTKIEESLKAKKNESY